MTIHFDAKLARRNPSQYLDSFTSFITRTISRKQEVNPKTFSYTLHEIKDVFELQGEKQVFNKKAKRLAETLVSTKNNNLAGIVYSILIKLNQDDMRAVETFATNAFIIAKRLHDPIHIMARANDLKQIYKVTAPNKEKLVNVLYEEKRALSDICKNYDTIKNRYKTLSRELQPKEAYMGMLNGIRVEIAQALKDSDPKLARQELLKAQEYFGNIDSGKYSKKIALLLKEIDKISA